MTYLILDIKLGMRLYWLNLLTIKCLVGAGFEPARLGGQVKNLTLRETVKVISQVDIITLIIDNEYYRRLSWKRSN